MTINANVTPSSITGKLDLGGATRTFTTASGGTVNVTAVVSGGRGHHQGRRRHDVAVGYEHVRRHDDHQRGRVERLERGGARRHRQRHDGEHGHVAAPGRPVVQRRTAHAEQQQRGAAELSGTNTWRHRCAVDGYEQHDHDHGWRAHRLRRDQRVGQRHDEWRGHNDFSGNNTYTGTTTVSAATLSISNANALGGTGGGTTVGAATLQLQGGLSSRPSPSR